MSTTDARSPGPVDDLRLETDLRAVFAFEPSTTTITRVDNRMARALPTWDPQRRPSRLRPGRRATVVGMLAAMFVLGGASGSLQSLYMLAVGPFDAPWHRGEAVNISRVVDGYRVTIDRAYADATRLALAISVEDELRRPGTTQVSAYSTIVTDEAGRYGGVGATSHPDGRFAAANIVWLTPAALPLPAGNRRIQVEIPFIEVRDDSAPPPDADDIGWNPWHRYPGPWTFDFELVVDGGTTVSPGAVAEVEGVEIKVTRVIVASNIVRVETEIGGTLPSGEGSWAPVGVLRHGDRTMRFVVSAFEPDGKVALMTDGGVDDARGHWTVTFDELVGAKTRLAGPWVIQFSVP